MDMGGAESLILLVMVASIGLLIFALVDLVKRPATVWEAAGHNQLVWALVVIFVGFIGPLLYVVVARPALDAAASQHEPASIYT